MYKVGDRFIVIKDAFYPENNGSIYNLVAIKEGDSWPLNGVKISGDGELIAEFRESEIQKLPVTFETLQPGNFVMQHSTKVEVLFCNGKILILDDGDDDHCLDEYIISKIKVADGLKLIDAEQEAVKEMTVAEVEAAVGHKVKIVKETK